MFWNASHFAEQWRDESACGDVITVHVMRHIGGIYNMITLFGGFNNFELRLRLTV